MLASFAMGTLIIAAFSAVAGLMSGTDQGTHSGPLMTAGWSPAGRIQRSILVVGQVDAPRPAPTSPYLVYASTSFDSIGAAALLGADMPPATPSLDGFASDPNPVVTPASPEDTESSGPEQQIIQVDRGDTLSGILSEANVQADDVQAILSALKSVYDPSGIRAGQDLTLTFGKPATAEPRAGAGPFLLSLAFKPSIERDVAVTRSDGGGYEAAEIVKRLTEKTDRAAASINGSLYQAAMNAGMPEGAIADLIRIYSYDVDFQRDVQAGDKFDVLFTRYYDDNGQVVKSGTILSATLTLQGEKKSLTRFTNPDDQTTDYYNPKGWSGKRMLMKTPVDGARLSSGFGMRRHPILGYNKMHKGIDFAAPTGTPVMASGNGTVELAGVAGGYGNYVRLRHTSEFKTAYGHLSRFARGIKPGVKVRQGQVIAYIGTTGRSTGPHLHYEILKGNAQVNPQGMKLPTGTNLTGKAMAAFKAERARFDDMIRKTPLISAVAAKDTGSVARP
jgi:murein DD-endopeptidase MepM/ murein hydrolase activator NlpD